MVGGDDTEQQRYGDFLTKEERYAQAGEFLDVFRGAWGEEGYDFSGEHVRVAGAHVPDAPEPPRIYIGGSSQAGIDVAAEHVDVYLTWGEPPAQVAEKLDRVREAARRTGRDVRFGIRLHAIARDTAEEAWAEADRLLAGLDPAAIERAQEKLRASQSEGQRRMVALHDGRTDSLEVSPNLWAGVGLVRGGAGTALVGSHEEVADRIAEYHELGIDEFILSGYPHLEEAYRVGEGVLARAAPPRAARRRGRGAAWPRPCRGVTPAPSSPVVVVSGNPRAGSRTVAFARRAGEAIAEELGGPEVRVVDLAEPASSPDEARAEVASAAVAVIASPTYKATYTGLLKLFLDGYGPLALDRVVAVPLMVHGGPAHALAADLHLRPLLLELGATCPTPALSVAEHELEDPDAVLAAWRERAGWALRALAGAAVAA